MLANLYCIHTLNNIHHRIFYNVKNAVVKKGYFSPSLSRFQNVNRPLKQYRNWSDNSSPTSSLGASGSEKLISIMKCIALPFPLVN